MENQQLSNSCVGCGPRSCRDFRAHSDQIKNNVQGVVPDEQPRMRMMLQTYWPLPNRVESNDIQTR